MPRKFWKIVNLFYFFFPNVNEAEERKKIQARLIYMA